MKKHRQRLAALGLAVLLAAGGWAGLLAGWRSAYTMGQQVGQLPRMTLQEGGGIKLTLGARQTQLEAAEVKRFFEKAGRVELLFPRSLRIAGLGVLSGVFLAEKEEQHAVGQKRLTGGFGPAEERWF